MSRKYTPPSKKKKKGIPQIARTQAAPTPAAPSAAATPVTEFSMARPPQARPAAKAPPIDSAADAVKYASLPCELRRILLYTLAAIVLIVILWLIFR